MLRSLLSTAVLALLSLPSAAQGVPRPGERLPASIELTGLAQTPAKHLSEFYGRAVLLDFFASWCAPCAQAVPHLNELEKEFGRRGFAVVGVTSEGPKKTEPWIQKFGAEYAYGYDAGSALERLFQIKAIPFGVLLDAEGVVAWIGDPRRLTSERIERALEGASAKAVWQWPEPARALAPALYHGQYAAALEQAKELGASDGFDPLVFVQERVRNHLTRFGRLLERGDYPEAFQFAERAARELAGLPEGETITVQAEQARKDPEVQAGLAAHERLTELERRAAAVRSPAEGEALRVEIDAFLKDVQGKRLEKRTRALLDSIDRALENARKHEQR